MASQSKDDFFVGDIITSSSRGYFIVEGFDSSNRRFVRLKTKMIAKHNGVRIKSSKVYTFYEKYCTKITEEMICKHREASNEKWDRVLKLVNPEAEVESEAVKNEAPLLIKEPEFLKLLEPPPSLENK